MRAAPSTAISRGSSRPLVALLPSPLLGAAVWQPVEAHLREHGVDAIAVSPTHTPRTPEDVVADLLEVLPADRDLVVVPHSNAGLYVPELTRRRPVVGAIFVDAVLPPPRGSIAVAPPGLVERLRHRVAPDGLLPVWTQWWDPAEVAGLFPSGEVQSLVEREQHRLPLSYLTASVDIPPGWDDVPAVYVAFGETYREELGDAAKRGWPVSSIAGGHLHMLVEPAAVAVDLTRLLTSLGVIGQ